MSTVYQRSIHVGLVVVSFTSLGGFGRTEIEKKQKNVLGIGLLKAFLRISYVLWQKYRRVKLKVNQQQWWWTKTGENENINGTI